jgi:hypothetical protein
MFGRKILLLPLPVNETGKNANKRCPMKIVPDKAHSKPYQVVKCRVGALIERSYRRRPISAVGLDLSSAGVARKEIPRISESES